MSSDPRDQPFLHDLVTTLRAPMVALAAADGQMRESGVQGVYAFDRRVLSAVVVSVDGQDVAGLRLILATGVVDELPEIDGFFDHYGRSVFHCAQSVPDPPAWPWTR